VWYVLAFTITMPTSNIQEVEQPRSVPGALERWFKFGARGSSLQREVLAGLTTFTTMAYVLVVHPQILSQTGMDFKGLITVTALAAAVFSVLMGIWTNYPIAMAPGMGINAFFAFHICIAQNIPWRSALGLVFYSGLIFFFLSVSGLRQKIIESFPNSLKGAITAGIGLFIAFLGLKNAGIVVANPNTFVTLGNITAPAAALSFFGIILAVVLLRRRVPGALILSILLLTLIGLFLPGTAAGSHITKFPDRLVDWPSSIGSLFLQLDFAYFWTHLGQTIPIILSLLFSDLFGSMAALLAIGSRAGLLDQEGNLPRIREALAADATAAAGGALLGTSTTIQYIESAAGVEEGGRTGLVSFVVALCFLFALFFNPIIQIIPVAATAPALVVIGIFMMEGLAKLDLKDLTIAAPAVITVLLMVLGTIADGLALGFIAYVLIYLFTGKARQISVLSFVLAAVFLLHYFVK
jgi:AGZA family xanthine/uracil permease-like MFS transporter